MQMKFIGLAFLASCLAQSSDEGEGSIEWSYRHSWIRYINNGGRVIGASDGAQAVPDTGNGTYIYDGTARANGTGVDVQGKGSVQFIKYCLDIDDPSTCILNSRFNDPLVYYRPDGDSVLTVTVMYGLSTAGPGNQEGPFTLPLAGLLFENATSSESDGITTWVGVNTTIFEDRLIVFDNSYDPGATFGNISFKYPTRLLAGGGASSGSSGSVSESGTTSGTSGSATSGTGTSGSATSGTGTSGSASSRTSASRTAASGSGASRTAASSAKESSSDMGAVLPAVGVAILGPLFGFLF